MVVQGHKQVDVFKTPTYARYGNLCTCGMVWVCPICASKVSEDKRGDIARAVSAAKDQELVCILVTYTYQHKGWHKLGVMLPAFSGARRAMRQGHAWLRIRDQFGIVGVISALEVTHGWLSGWHPHVHELVFMRSSDVRRFEAQLRKRYREVGSKFGLSMNRHGLDVRSTDAEVSAYIAKYGRQPTWGVDAELAKANVKRGRGKNVTPFGMLEAGLRGDDTYRELFQEFAAAFKGKKQLRWSPGLRKLLLGDELERSDEEIAADEGNGGTLLGYLTLDQWRVVLANDVRGELLQVAASGEWSDVVAFLDQLMEGAA